MSPVPRKRPNRGQIADDAEGQSRHFRTAEKQDAFSPSAIVKSQSQTCRLERDILSLIAGGMIPSGRAGQMAIVIGRRKFICCALRHGGRMAARRAGAAAGQAADRWAHDP